MYKRQGIYYVYPLQRERSSLAVISQIFLSGGIVLVALIGGVAYVCLLYTSRCV